MSRNRKERLSAQNPFDLGVKSGKFENSLTIHLAFRAAHIYAPERIIKINDDENSSLNSSTFVRTCKFIEINVDIDRMKRK